MAGISGAYIIALFLTPVKDTNCFPSLRRIPLYCNVTGMLYIRRLHWDDWNEAHIARHEVSRREVEQACSSDHIYLQVIGRG